MFKETFEHIQLPHPLKTLIVALFTIVILFFTGATLFHSLLGADSWTFACIFMGILIGLIGTSLIMAYCISYYKNPKKYLYKPKVPEEKAED